MLFASGLISILLLPKKTFKLGQKVDVIVNSVDLAARTIDFIPAVY